MSRSLYIFILWGNLDGVCRFRMEIEYEGYCRTVDLKGLVFLFANWREGRIPHLQANNM